MRERNETGPKLLGRSPGPYPVWQNASYVSLVSFGRLEVGKKGHRTTVWPGVESLQGECCDQPSAFNNV